MSERPSYRDRASVYLGLCVAVASTGGVLCLVLWDEAPNAIVAFFQPMRGRRAVR